MMVVLVDHGNLGIGAFEPRRRRQPAKPGADDHDPWPLRLDRDLSGCNAFRRSVHDDTSRWPPS
jgi:hypothetical protein